ncbi:choice-of-anchor A family protein [Yinghuangia soli]|uniref:Choice-of-anchor A family protein n=1 Tax=Yinghuangia soli TaxID=2908204 RepID=A0AA41Q5Z1_9ACTN|nr:choice-of-anchor A family protein [Yinghuangia soli]MCF2532189.1 choice-of-anchor A family protein [Yinghuangia soli]
MIGFPAALLISRTVGISRRNMNGAGPALAAAAALVLVGAGPGHAAQTEKNAGRAASCPAAGAMPGIGQTPRFTDDNVAVFVGGDFTADGSAAEAEGLVVVKGRAAFAKAPGGVFNVGRAGAGSGIVPTSGNVMLAVGADLSIAKGTTVDVGHGLLEGPKYGGSVQVGGALTATGRLETNGGASPSRLGAAQALGAYAGFDRTMQDESASLGALRPTGTAQRTGSTVTFRGAPAAGSVQVFEISAADLDGASSFVFEAIPENTSVLVNVTGAKKVAISPMSVGFNGERVDLYSSPKYGAAAARILYNFREAPALTLSGGGNFMGSILAPKASADLTASTNGRLYFGGSARMHGTGNETHNYPWNGTPPFACKPGTPAAPGPTPPPASRPPQSGPPTATAQPPGATPAGPETPEAPGSSDNPAPPNGGTPLAETGGSDSTLLVATAAAVLAGGAAVFAVARRRRRA